jgi:hypothetical protein
MRRTNRYIAALAVLFFAGACGTAADTPLSPDSGPVMDGGGYATGGNRTDGDGEGEAGTMSMPSDTTSRNGGYATGGN